MKECLSGDDIVATIILLRDEDSRAVVLVEGESDCSVFDGHINDSVATTLPAGGKNNVVSALLGLESAGVSQVVGVVDADHTGAGVGLANLFITEHYDLDVDVMRLPGVVERFVLTHFDRQQVISHKQATGTSLGEVALEAAGPIGLLRLISDRDALGLSLRDFPAEPVINVGSMSCDVARLAAIASARSDSTVPASVVESTLEGEIARLGAATLANYASGHDACAVLALLGRRTFGARAASREQVERGLRACVGCGEFPLLKVVQELSTWGKEQQLALWHGCA